MTTTITYTIIVPEHSPENPTDAPRLVVMTRAALDELAACDLAAYYNLIRYSPELWDAEWNWARSYDRDGQPLWRAMEGGV